jgi:murein DD-endopeptidase MepM/ murein hydrolase activator NlpD
MSRRSAIVRVLALIMAVTLLGAAPANADNGDDKNRIDAELARTQATLEAATEQAQHAAAEYARANAQLPAAQNLLADARGKVAAAEVAARQAERDAAAAHAVEVAAAKEYDAAAAKVTEARQQVSEFVSQAYRGSGFLEINSILESGSPSEFAMRIGYLNQVAAGQRRALDTLTIARMNAKVHANAAEAARQRADAARNAARAALASTRAAESAAEQAATEVQNLITRRQQAMAAADQQRGAVLARYSELTAESDRIGAELRAASGGGGWRAAPPSGGGAFLMQPTRGWKSSDFGMRFDPFYQVYQLHAGVDIASPTGQPIYAAADGRVVHAGWSGGYGNYTCISHGSYQGADLSTCYGHQSAIDVAVGQFVRRGQIIGRVGSTGASTGSHLHFEVRRGGTPVQPLGWLPSCFC